MDRKATILRFPPKLYERLIRELVKEYLTKRQKRKGVK